METALALRPDPKIVTPVQMLEYVLKNEDAVLAAKQKGLTFDQFIASGFKGKELPKGIGRKAFFDGLFQNKAVAQKMLGIGGVAGMALNLFMPSERGFLGRVFSFALDALAIASFFNPALLLPVAALYVARGVGSILNGGTFAGLMDIGVSLLPALRSMKQLKKIAEIFTNKGFVTAASSLVRSGYGREAHQQFRLARKFIASKEAMKTGTEQGLRRTGEIVSKVVQPLKEGFRDAA